MRTTSTLPIATLGVLLLVAVSVQRPAFAGAPDLAAVSTTSGGIHWQPLLSTDGWTLTVAGEDRWIRAQFGPGETPTFRPVDDSGQPLPDGQYTWELRTVRRETAVDPNATANGRGAAAEGARPDQGFTTDEPAAPLTQSGAFTIASGAIVSGGVESTAAADTRAANMGGGSSEELVINEDLFVLGSTCVGTDCVDGEDFGFDTLRLKENNTRIQFNDTSADVGFPTNNWQIRANDSDAGGANYLAFVDQGADGTSETGTRVFTVEAGAGANALYVDEVGRVGFGTATPVVELQTVDGNTPTLRLEQDGSSGFTPQTWDVAGNEANFFVRDVNSGSLLPFRIRPGAPTSAVDVSPDGVGIGTASPTADLHINDLDGDGWTAVRLTGSGSSWDVRQNANGQLILGKIGSGGRELRIDERLDANGPTLTVQGSVEGTQFISTSSREVKTAFERLDPSDVLAKLAALPVSAWRYAWEDASARHVGPMAEDFQRLFSLGDGKTIGGGDADGVLMAAIQGLVQKMDDTFAAKDAEIAKLKSELAEIKAALADR